MAGEQGQGTEHEEASYERAEGPHAARRTQAPCHVLNGRSVLEVTHHLLDDFDVKTSRCWIVALTRRQLFEL